MYSEQEVGTGVESLWAGLSPRSRNKGTHDPGVWEGPVEGSQQSLNFQPTFRAYPMFQALFDLLGIQ